MDALYVARARMLLHGCDSYNVNFAVNYGEAKEPAFDEFVRLAREELSLPVMLRYGGFSACSCDDIEKQVWPCQHGSEFHSCGRSAYEGTLYASPNGPVMLTGCPVGSSEDSERYLRTAYQFRRRAEAFGILDKYHFRPPQKRSFWENDDCNVTLGHLGDVPADEANGVVGELRALLGAPRPPIYAEITADNLAVIKYQDMKLERCEEIIPLNQLTAENLASLYRDVGWRLKSP